MSSPCVAWATEADLFPPYTDLDGVAGDISWLFDMASEVLYNLSDQVYSGECERTVRPPRACGHRSGCGCELDGVVLRLPSWPVRAVSEVLIDGAVLDPSRYRVDNRDELVLVPQAGDSVQRWPTVQQIDEPTTEDGTWSVTYTSGEDPPQGGVHAAAALTGEFIMACNPELRDRCQLPRNAVSVSGKGRTVAMVDPAQLAERGETGVPIVDLWLRADRWGRSHQAGGVDTGAPRFRVATV